MKKIQKISLSKMTNVMSGMELKNVVGGSTYTDSRGYCWRQITMGWVSC
jgi:natural product precursor